METLSFRALKVFADLVERALTILVFMLSDLIAFLINVQLNTSSLDCKSYGKTGRAGWEQKLPNVDEAKCRSTLQAANKGCSDT